MKKFLLVMLVPLLYTVPALAQTVTLIDSKTKEPLVGANIFTGDRSVFVVTDKEGKASLEKFKESEIIIFSYIGYETIKFSYEEVLNRGLIVALKQKPLTMSQVVVSANRWTQDTREVPVTVAQITPEERRLQNPQTTADLLAISNQVFIQKSQMGGGSPMIRGFATNRVLLVVDGVRMNNAIFRGGNLQNVISLDPNAIENTEVIFGPGSVSYGSDAIGGVMSFSTLNPRLSINSQPRIESNAMTRITSANWEKTGHFDFNIGYHHWATVSSITYSKFEDMRMGSNGPDKYWRREYVRRIEGKDWILINKRPNIQKPSRYSQLNLMQKFRFRPSEEWDLKLGIHYSTTGNLPRYDRLIEKENGRFRKAEWYYGPQQWFMSSFNANYYAKSKLFDQLKITAAYQGYEESRNDRNFRDPNLRNREEYVWAYSLNFDFEKQLTDQSSIFYGLEGIVNKVYSKAHVTNINTAAKLATSTRYPDDSTWQSYAAFMNYKNNLNGKWTITGGLRYNQYLVNADFTDQLINFPFDKAEINRGSLTGSVGTVFRPGSNWQLNIHTSSGFRAPNIDDIGKIFDSEPGSVIVPNPHLDPEYAYNVELGIQKLIDQNLKVEVAAFYTFLDNALARRDFTLGGQDSVMYDGTMSRVQAIQNVASARVWGLQGDMELQLTSFLKLSSYLNIQKGKEEAGDKEVPVRHIAPTFGSTHLTYDYRKLNVDAYVKYNGKISYADLAPSEKGKPHLYAQDENGNPYSPAWQTLNLKARYLLSENVTLIFGLENVTDQRYRPYSSGIAAPGRNVIFGIHASL